MAHRCKKCNKVTRKKKVGSFMRKPRCRGCGSLDFIDIEDALVDYFDFEDFIYPNDEGYDDFEGMEVIAEGPSEVIEDSFVEQEETSSEPAYTPEPEPDRSYGSSSFGSGSESSSYDSGSSDCDSCDCGGCD
jgi:phage FluMu protein Com